VTVVFNFKKEFADRVALGVKTQTVRPHRKDGRLPRIGEAVNLYTGLRTKATRLLASGVVYECLGVQIDPARGVLKINGIGLAPDVADEFARRDGFSGALVMADWFVAQYGKEALPFNGYCTRWLLTDSASSNDAVKTGGDVK
jgi:hypothetical protein